MLCHPQYNIQTFEIMLQQECADVSPKRPQLYQQKSYQPKRTTKIEGKTEKDRCELEELKFLEQKKLKNEDEISDSSSEVSLESDFLEQHFYVVDEKIETYQICSATQNLPNFISNQSTPQKQQALRSFTLKQYIRKLGQSPLSLPQILTQNFLKYLQKEPNFCNYVRHIFYSFSNQRSQQVVQLVFKVWAMYVPYLSLSLSVAEVQRMATLISKKICQMGKSTVQQSQAQKREMAAKHRLYYILTTTTLYVIQNIFKNPFYPEPEEQTNQLEDNLEPEHYERKSKQIKTQESI